jgi:aminoglycoside phosphotransferase (APT) family kinase protein
MNQPGDIPACTVSTDELQSALVEALHCHFNGKLSITWLERRLSAYRSSFALEELDIGLGNGTILQLMFKDSSTQALLRSARNVKPAFLYDPLREIEVYQKVLFPLQLGTAACFGTFVDQRLGRYWLFLERVPGVELYQVGELARWQQAASWLARLHRRLAGVADHLSPVAHLLTYDADYYRQWPRRALAFRKAEQGHRGLQWLEGRYERVIEFLVALPVTFLHGEFYASNVLLQETTAGLRVCPVDWEMAGLGPGLIDLAALTAGKWTEAERRSLALAYHSEMAPGDAGSMKREAFLDALDWCRLHLAVQWLGWSPAWSPPREHAHDWLAEALNLAEKIGL